MGSPRQSGRGRTTARTTAACVAAVALLGTSACVTMPADRSGAKAPWKPPSPEKFLPKYDEVTDHAAKRLDTGEIAEVQSGPLLLASQAAYKIAGARSAAGLKETTTKPVERSDTQVYLPRFDDYPAWFVDSATVSDPDGGKTTAVGLNLRADAGTDWKRIASVLLDSGVELPELAEAPDGSAVPVDAATSGKLARPADVIGAAYAAYLEGGQDAPQAVVFAPHPDTMTWLDIFEDEEALAQQSGGTVQRSIDDVVVRSLETKDGGALVVFSLQETANLELSGRPIDLDEDNPVRYFTGESSAEEYLKSSYAWQGAAYIPPKGKDSDLVTLLGVQRDLTTAEVS